MCISGTSKGLGIRIVGGRTLKVSNENAAYFGIFIKEVIKDSLAEQDGEYRHTSCVYTTVLTRVQLTFTVTNRVPIHQ